MRKSILKAIGNTVQDLVKENIKTSFTKKELKELGTIIPKVEITAKDIQDMRGQKIEPKCICKDVKC